MTLANAEESQQLENRFPESVDKISRIAQTFRKRAEEIHLPSLESGEGQTFWKLTPTLSPTSPDWIQIPVDNPTNVKFFSEVTSSKLARAQSWSSEDRVTNQTQIVGSYNEAKKKIEIRIDQFHYLNNKKLPKQTTIYAEGGIYDVDDMIVKSNNGETRKHNLRTIIDGLDNFCSRWDLAYIQSAQFAEDLSNLANDNSDKMQE